MLSSVIKKTLLTSVVLAIIVSVLVLMNTPKNIKEYQESKRHMSIIIRTFVISFILCFLVVYVMQDNDSNSMMTNIIKSEPDF